MSTKRILIIEDDLDLCEALMDFLKAEGYLIKCAQNSVKGEALIRKGNYHLVLLDYKMPLLTGMDILKRLKADKIRKRIFIVSGRPYIGRSLKKENLSDMVSCIIPKPINLENLLEKIREV